MLLNFLKKFIHPETNKDPAGIYIKNNIQNEIVEIFSSITNIERDKIRLTYSFDEYCTDPVSLNKFITTLKQKYQIEIDSHIFAENLSLNLLIKYILKNYKNKINQNSSKESSPKVNANTNISLKDIAYTLQVGRDAFDERLAILVTDINELLEKLKKYCSNGNRNIENLFRGSLKKDKSKLSIFEEDELEDFLKILINNNKLSKIAYIWTKGAKVNWKLLYENQKPRRVSLPTYPFEKKGYWVGN